MRKSIISIMTFLLCCVTLHAQQSTVANVPETEEIHSRTYYQPIDNKGFVDPAEVIAKGKELLDTMERKITTAPSVPYLPPDLQSGEINYYIPYYHEILQTSLAEQINYQDVKRYQDFYDQIIWNDDGTPNMTKAATAKAYMAFYYLINNAGKPSRMRVGRIDEHFPLLGVYADAFAELQIRFGNNDPYLWFTYILYNGDAVDHMIPVKDAKQADIISKQMLYDDWQKYGITPAQTDEWLKFMTSWSNKLSNSEGYVNTDGRTISVIDNGNWYQSVFLSSQDQLNIRNEERGGYLPLAVLTSHEFQHIKDIFPGTVMRPSLAELTAVLRQIVESDAIYRQIHPTPDSQPVEYATTCDVSKIKIGEVAIFFRNLSKKYNTDNYAQLLLKPEAIEYINEEYLKDADYMAHFVIEYNKQNPNLFSPQQIREYGKQCLHSLLNSPSF